MQRNYTSKIYRLQHLDYWERFKHLNIQSVQRRRGRYIILHMWKILHKQSPNDLNISFTYKQRHGFQAKLPTGKGTNKAKYVYDSSFGMQGPKIWNILPKAITIIDGSINLFKNALSSFLVHFPDQPPVPVYMDLQLFKTTTHFFNGILH